MKREVRDGYLIEEHQNTCFFSLTLEQFPDSNSNTYFLEQAINYLNTILELCQENDSNYGPDNIFKPELSVYQ